MSDKANRPFVEKTPTRVQTTWRRTESAANSSPLIFPANSEKYRDFSHFDGPKLPSTRGSTVFSARWFFQAGNRNRDVSGKEQGTNRYLVCVNREFWKISLLSHSQRSARELCAVQPSSWATLFSAFQASDLAAGDHRG